MNCCARSPSRWRPRTSPRDLAERHNRRIVAAQSGDLFLESMHDRLSALLAELPSAVVICSRRGEIEATYAALEDALRR